MVRHDRDVVAVPVTPTHQAVESTVRFFEATGFYDAIRRYPKAKQEATIRGVVVPHHLVADDVIAETLALVANQEVSRIVLIGPNHFELGSAAVTTSDNAWVSPVGTVAPDVATIVALTAQTSYVKNDPAVMNEEHAHASVMPFLSYYFPGVPVVPLALSMKLTHGDLNDLIARLVAMDDGTTLYVATVDFSHYLSETESEQRDQETAALMVAGKVDSLLALSSQHIDSPRSIVAVMEILRHLGYGRVTIKRNTNSADYLPGYTGEVTSYFGIVFEK